MRPEPERGQLPPHPSLGPDGRPAVRLRFEGRWIEGREGQSIAAVLHRNGIDVLSRSFKYHRPRGLYCAAGACPNCQLQVDGLPGVVACQTVAQGGETVQRERGWPNVDRDALAFADRVSRWFPVGFQFRYLRRHPRAFHVWERVLAHMAGGRKRLPVSGGASARNRTPISCALLVIGGGPAGLAAALAAAERGADVVLVERSATVGGRLRAERSHVRFLDTSMSGMDLAAELASQLAGSDLVKVIRGEALGWYEGNVVPVMGDRLYEIAADSIVVATGSYEEPVPFRDNDRPGVMTAGAAQWLLNVEKVSPGRVCVVVAADDRGLLHAVELIRCGVQVLAVVDTRTSGADTTAAEVLAPHGIRHVLGGIPVRAHGTPRLKGLEVRTAEGETLQFPCDTVVVAGQLRASEEIELQVSYDGANRLAPGTASTGRPALFTAGGSAGAMSVQAALDTGTAAGRAAGIHAGGAARRKCS
jgi:sarcosine oxidase subunit alpha